MSSHFDHVVVGGGPMGASAAKYLATSGAKVLLIAAPEAIDDVLDLHSSHNDVSRIARGLDSNEVWSQMARTSIARFRDLEEQSSTPFFTESGCLTLFDRTRSGNVTKMAELQRVGLKHDVPNVNLDPWGLAERFPGINAPAESQGVYEPAAAGWINPRNYVRAQIIVGQQAGLEVWSEPVTSVSLMGSRVNLTTSTGRICTCDQVLFAMGAYSLFDPPVPLYEELTVFARTVVRVELDDNQLKELGQIPSMIVRGATDIQNCYVVPPVKYPDGKHYIKIGGGRRTQTITSRSELDGWFAGDGDPLVTKALLHRLEELLPSIRPQRWISQACAITVTSSGLPWIEKLGPNIGILTGGNGHAAKCGDELGRLGAELMLGNTEWSDGYEPGVFGERSKPLR